MFIYAAIELLGLWPNHKWSGSCLWVGCNVQRFLFVDYYASCQFLFCM